MTGENTAAQGSHSNGTIKLALAWLAVGVPLLWGVVMTLQKALALFR